MPNDVVNKLWECITVIEAQNHLQTLQAADWHKQSDKNRKKIHKDLFNSAYPFQEKKTVNTHEDLMKALRR